MKKMLLIFMILIMPFTYTLFHCTISNAALNDMTNNKNGIAKFDGSKIVAWTQLDHAQLVLANGQTAAELATKNTLDTIKISNPVDICFVLDTSGSMSGDRISTLKSATNDLINNLLDKFDNKSKFRVSIIKFGDVELLKNFTPCTDENMNDIYRTIASLNATGGTPTAEAVDLANNLWNNSGDLADYKYTILITDGYPNDDNEAKTAIKNFKEAHNDIKFLSIFVGSETSDIKSIFSYSDELIYTSNANFANTIVNGIWNFIFWNYIDADNVTTVEDANNVSYSNDSYYIIADDELLYGATLIMNYSVHIKTVEKLKLIEVKDYLANELICTSTNPVGTYIDDNTIEFNIQPSNNSLEEDYYEEEIAIEVNCSRVLTSANDIEYVKNTADVKVVTEDNRVFETNGEMDNDNKIRSNKLQIMPPFGQTKQEEIIPYIEKIIILLIVTITPIIVYKK